MMAGNISPALAIMADSVGTGLNLSFYALMRDYNTEEGVLTPPGYSKVRFAMRNRRSASAVGDGMTAHRHQ